jgi:hypothetical protein
LVHSGADKPGEEYGLGYHGTELNGFEDYYGGDLDLEEESNNDGSGDARLASTDVW